MTARICLNAICKNESDKVLRFLNSVAPYLDCFAIVDTGSTDDTIQKIEGFFASKSIPGEVTKASFVNFEQARNAGLRAARASPYPYEYIMLADFDMEFQVDSPTFRDNLTAPAYNIIQKAGGTSYFNTRLLRRDQKGLYHGVTHEFLDAPGAEQLLGVSFIDHADGANRPNKFARDILLLLAGLKKEPKNERYQFYLAQSYRDAGRYKESAAAYKKRVTMGGWEEETWNAQLNYAHCLNALKDTDGFIRELQVAYNMRPSRAETLYDLAKYYREHEMNAVSLLYSEAGIKVPPTKDVLFVTDHVYQTGLREEYSICAFYLPQHRAHGYSVCSNLAIDPRCTEWSRELARNNLFFYIQPLKELCPSFAPSRLAPPPVDGYTFMNPSVANKPDGSLWAIVRGVNYTIDEAGRYLIKGTNGEANGTNPIHTRNFLAALNPDLTVKSTTEVFSPKDFPTPAYNLVVGFEDERLFWWKGDFWVSATVRERNAQGMCEQTLARIGGDMALTDWKPMVLPNRLHEKNWMPWVMPGNLLKFVYKLGTTLDPNDLTLAPLPVPYNVDRLSGGSQLIPFMTGWLALVHESRTRPGDGKRYYQHRFVFMNTTTSQMKVSKAFVLHDKQIEFAAGLAWHPDGKRLVISYGIKDCEAWLATIEWHEVTDLLGEMAC
jgi:tetratricopeptide (TPR) repeat protein